MKTKTAPPDGYHAGALIRDIRLRKGLSQHALALAIGAEDAFVQQIEKKANVAFTTLARIASALDLNIEFAPKGESK